MMLANGKLSKPIFRKHLLLFIITILIPTFLLLTFQVYRVSKEVGGQAESVSADQLESASRNLNMLLDQMNQISLQMSLSPDFLDLVDHPFDQPAYQYAKIKDELRSRITSNQMFHSIYLDILQNGKVLTTGEGLYDKSGFYDKEMLEQLEKANAAPNGSWVGLRELHDGQQTQVLTFSRAVPPTQSSVLGLLVLNIHKDVFVHMLMNPESEQTGTTLLFDPEGQLVSDSIQGLKAKKIAETIVAGMVHKEDVKVAGVNYILSGEKSPSNGWTILQLTPFESYNTQLSNAVWQAVLILIVLLFVGIGLAYLFASILYDPWRKLADRLQGILPTPSAGKRDDYTLINSAIHDLITVIQRNEPIVRDHLVHDLLHGHMPEYDHAAERFREVGVRFVYPQYAVVVVTGEPVDEAGNTGPRGLHLYSLAEETLRSRFLAAGTILDRTRFGFILNLDSGEYDLDMMARIEDACREIVQNARERFHAGMSICISGIRPLERLHEAYEQVKRTLAHKALIQTDICFAHDNMESLTLQYPTAYQKLVLNSILTGQREAAEGYVSELFDLYLANNGYSYHKLMQMIIMLMSHILASLAQEGYDIGPLMTEIDLIRLQNCQNRQELLQLILSQIECIIDYLETVRGRSGNYGEFVQQAFAFIEQNYTNNISISDVASSIGISASYLSRIFKSEVGKTPLEYLTEYRLNVSKELLKDRTRSLKLISQMVGYNDVHTFIRFFKKIEGTTPGDYRKKMMANS